jgi:hypothetical protein
MAFSKRSHYSKYLPMVNAKIKKLQVDGTMEKIVEKAINSATTK